MKVLDLGCGNNHRFEGWFASEADFLSQEASSLVQCPVCTDSRIVRLPSAPRLNVSGLRDVPAPSAAADPRVAGQAHFMRAMQHMLAHTEDVGERFPEEARRIHYGEAEERGIRGRASAADAESLREEGIEVVAVPLPEALKGTLQ